MQKKKEAFPASQTGWDYEALKKKTLKQFRSGKDLFSKGGAFAPLLKDFLEAALQAELEEHLEQEAEEQNNRKNGYNTKPFIGRVLLCCQAWSRDTAWEGGSDFSFLFLKV